MMYHFCTYFDSAYILYGLTLFRSLKATGIDFKLYVACLDAQSMTVLNKLDDHCLIPVSLEEIEEADPELLPVKNTRTTIEYYFTLSPVLPLFLFKKFPNIDILTYLDADLFFYSSPEPLYRELGVDGAISIIEHRFPSELKYREVFGKFNVQWQSYRHNQEAVNCLQRWRTQCLNWCYDRLDGNKFADQKYLEEWPQKFKNVKIITHNGAGLAPWNWMRYKIVLDPLTGIMKIDGMPLIFYHFHGFKILNRFMLHHGLGNYRHVMPDILLQWFYSGYYRELKATRNFLLMASGITFPLKVQNRRTGFSQLRAVISGLRHRGIMRIKG